MIERHRGEFDTVAKGKVWYVRKADLERLRGLFEAEEKTALRALRKVAKHTLEEMAGFTQFSLSYLAALERGEKPTPPEVLEMYQAVAKATSRAQKQWRCRRIHQDYVLRRKQGRRAGAKKDVKLLALLREFVGEEKALELEQVAWEEVWRERGLVVQEEQGGASETPEGDTASVPGPGPVREVPSEAVESDQSGPVRAMFDPAPAAPEALPGAVRPGAVRPPIGPLEELIPWVGPDGPAPLPPDPFDTLMESTKEAS